jgi:hypothetical protein
MSTRVVTISHTTGAGGETIGRTVADRLGFRYIDEEIITLAAEKEGVDPELVADTERRKGFLSRLFSGLTEMPEDVGVAGATVTSQEPDQVPRREDLRPVIVEAIHDMARRGRDRIARGVNPAGRPRGSSGRWSPRRSTRASRPAPAGAARAIRTVRRDNDAGRGTISSDSMASARAANTLRSCHQHGRLDGRRGGGHHRRGGSAPRLTDPRSAGPRLGARAALFR